MPVFDQPPQVAPSFALSEALQELQSTNAVLRRRFDRLWQRAMDEHLNVTEPRFRAFAAEGVQPFASFETEDDWTAWRKPILDAKAKSILDFVRDME